MRFSKKQLKVTPMVLLLAVFLVTASGALIWYWYSTTITHQIGVTIYGLDGYALNVTGTDEDLATAYMAKTTATKLGSATNTYHNPTDAFMLAIKGYEIPAGTDVQLRLNVTCTGAPEILSQIVVTAKGYYGITFYNTGVSKNVTIFPEVAGWEPFNINVNTNTTIPHADITRFAYDTTIPSYGGGVEAYGANDGNVLLIEVTVTPHADIGWLDGSLVYGENLVNLEVTAELGLESGL